MICAWKELLDILPAWMRQDVDSQGKQTLQEIRLRLQQPPELICRDRTVSLKRAVVREDLAFCVNAASRYSPWAAEGTAQGYLTAPGGHRIGLCGRAVVKQGGWSGLRALSSLCIRVARDFPGIAAGVPQTGSILILGRPGSGKTTLLRDLIRQISDRGPGSIAVVDEREELFPAGPEGPCFWTGRRTDILSGCGKAQGIQAAVRTMGPVFVAVDEITAQEDSLALLQAAGCGVRLLATAHGASAADLEVRPIYRSLVRNKIFDVFVVMQQDKSWKLERVCQYI